MRKVLILIFTFLFGAAAFSQTIRLSSDPDEFINGVTKLVKGNGKESYIECADNFEITFNGLDDADQKRVAELGVLLQKKKGKAPDFKNFLNALTDGTTNGYIDGADLEKFLGVTQKVLEKEKVTQFKRYFANVAFFMNDLTLYKSNYNSYQLDGGSFSFEYIEDVEEPTEIELLDKQLEEQKKKEDGEEKNAFDSWDDGGGGEEAGFEEDWGTFNESDWNEDSQPGKEEEKSEQAHVENTTDYGYEAPPLPIVEGAIIKIKDADIIQKSKFGEATIQKTSGSLMLTKNTYVGDTARFDWSNADMDEVYVDMGRFSFRTSQTRIFAADVKLTHTDATDEKVKGIFEFKPDNKESAEQSKYPRFMSYNAGIHVKNIGEDIDYYGGYSLEGQKSNSASVSGDPSRIIVSDGGDVKFKALSTRFDIQDSLITSDRVAIIILMDNDSLTHAGLALKYNQDVQLLRLTRKDKKSVRSPFFDTYHKIEIQTDLLKWNLADTKIRFYKIHGRGEVPSEFESRDYFDAKRHQHLQGLLSYHPLEMVVNYARQARSNTVFAADIASKFSIPLQNFKKNMDNLANLGFIKFMSRTGKITLNRKAYLYSLARKGKGDFDHISIRSMAKGASATLDLETKNLEIVGIKKFYLSLPLEVAVVPDSGKLTMVSNRDLRFEGSLTAGQFQFTGRNFRFDYDSFFVNMVHIDSIRLRIKKKKEDIDPHTKEKVHVLGNKLVYSSGVLYIDKMKNKSHKKEYPEYPIFDAVTGAYVYFDKKSILNRAYDTTVYFRIPPFVVDSLSQDDPEAVTFNGVFFSGGIFPPFEEVLRVMPDYAFGFNHPVSESGYDLYGDKGKFYNQVNLDGSGLRGDGQIKYLTSTLNSEDFIFYLDSVTTEGTIATVDSGDYQNDVTFPKGYVNHYNLLWITESDSMVVANIDSTIELYDAKALLDGEVVIRPTGMQGKGKLTSGKADVYGREYLFSKGSFLARRSNFKVNTDDEDKPAFLADSVKMDFNMVKDYADFSPEKEGFASTDFPYSQYKTSLSSGHWDIKKDIVIMEKPEDQELSTSYFYSTHPDQDSLAFNATKGISDLNDFSLKISGVPFIYVADSKIIPDSGKVNILENAEMEKLERAVLIVDSTNQFHKLDSGAIEILSKNQFMGEANYWYKNAVNDSFPVAFVDFKALAYSERKSDHRMYTLANGYIAEEDSFFISPKIQYYGEVVLDARKQFLDFDGFARVDLGENFSTDWLKFSGNIDPANVTVDLTDPRDADGQPLLTGIHLNANNDSLYSTFVASKMNDDDQEILTASGVLGYNPFKNEFRIADAKKDAGEAYSGNVFVLNDSSNTIRFEGEFNIANNIPKIFEVQGGGTGEGDLATGDMSFNMMSTIFFKIPSFLVTEMTDTIYAATRASYEALGDRYSMLPGIAEIAGEKPAQMFAQSQEELMLYEISSKFARTFVFNDVNLKWDTAHHALYTSDTVKLTNILKRSINAQMPGMFEIKKSSGYGDEVNVFLQPDSLLWYFLQYKENRLYMLSSSVNFNAGAHLKSTLAKTPPGEYAYGLADVMAKEEFLFRYNKDYKGMDLDSLNYDTLRSAQEELEKQIQRHISGAPVEQITGGEEDTFEDDIFFEDDEEEEDGLDFDSFDDEDEEEDTKEEDDRPAWMKDKDEKEEDEEDEDDFDLPSLEDEFENSSMTGGKDKKKKKKEKKPKVVFEEEEDLLPEEEEEDDMFDVDFGGDEDDFEMEEEEKPKPTKEKKKKEKKPKEKPSEEEEEEGMFDDFDFDDD